MTPKNFINTDIILIDIVGFSCHSSQEQLSIITYLTKSYIKMLSTLLHNSQMNFDRLIEAFVKFLSLHQDFEELMEQRELKRSSLHEFEDKHGKIKSAYLVWLRHSGIINPPNINFNSLLK